MNKNTNDKLFLWIILKKLKSELSQYIEEGFPE